MARNRPYLAQNDLDDVLRNLQRRLSALFGRGSVGGGGGASANNLSRNASSIFILLFAVWLGSGVYSVSAQERAVVLRFGKYVNTVGPGYNWHLPWPIERRILVNVSQQNSITDDAIMLTADTNLVHVNLAVQFIRPEPVKYLFAVRDPQETLVQVSESAMRESIGQAPLDKALAYDPSITRHAKALLQATLDRYDMGVQVLSVNLQDVNVPDPVHDAQLDALMAGKDRQRYQQEAETYRNEILPKARGRASKEVLDAQAYRQQVVALAQGETARFDEVLGQYEHAPAVTRQRMYLETLEGVYKGARKVVVDTKNNSMIYLPLDKLMGPGAIPGADMSSPRIPEIQVTPSEDPSRARGMR
jgi:membrane protease subunit HflK